MISPPLRTDAYSNNHAQSCVAERSDTRFAKQSALKSYEDSGGSVSKLSIASSTESKCLKTVISFVITRRD